MSDTDQGRLRPSWCRWKRSYRWRTCNPKKQGEQLQSSTGWCERPLGKKHAKLTSNHSVAPTLPYSPALQLAKTILLLGLNPSDNSVKPHHHLLVTQVKLQSELWHDVFVTFLHHFSNGLGQFHQYGGANCGFGVAFTPGVPLGSQNHITICRSKITHLDKEINVATLDQRWTVPGSVSPLMTPKTLWIFLSTMTLFTSTVMFSWPPSL